MGGERGYIYMYHHNKLVGSLTSTWLTRGGYPTTITLGHFHVVSRILIIKCNYQKRGLVPSTGCYIVIDQHIKQFHALAAIGLKLVIFSFKLHNCMYKVWATVVLVSHLCMCFVSLTYLCSLKCW